MRRLLHAARPFSILRPSSPNLEPHIEQAPALLSKGLPLGVVSGIRGSFRYRDARCIGEYSHSGAMPQKLRRDAVQASAKLITKASKIWDRIEQDGGDLVVTFGKIGTDPEQHSFSKVSGHVDLCLDMRSAEVETLERFERELMTTAGAIAEETGTCFEWGEKSGSTPALMDERLVAMMSAACESAKVPSRVMASEAGTFALAGVPSVMLFLRNENGSHNPDEHMELEDFDAGLAALVALFANPAIAWPQP
ncbi:M20/M25/M40 family metallo-hydrolase [Breoghania sp.]|uniref:M20/M25/M40 family metallo-hydrolase n=1 Tax=Breoghania sp. TaxID=2065378 RepID=UPI00260F13F7|nr:M20/M25/M40 family metallo-hydrolase [Breoghania sp.]MDJ0933333.1 M20/M25/M40 family metallo-hydrolase [Breoghania sp.]